MRHEDRKDPERLRAAIRNAHFLGPTYTDVARALAGSDGYKCAAARPRKRSRVEALGLPVPMRRAA